MMRLRERHVVPSFRESRWGASGIRSSFGEVEWPRVALYCPHDDDEVWLLGSFVASQAVFDERGTIFWGWDNTFMDSQGNVFRLMDSSTSGQAQNLVGDRVHREADVEAELSRAAALLERGRFDEARQITEGIDRARAELRERIPLECRICRVRRVYRSERVQNVVSKCWTIGLWEVELPTFLARVDNAA